MSKRLHRSRTTALSAAAALAVTIPLFAGSIAPAEAATATASATTSGMSPLWTAAVGGVVTSGPSGDATAVLLPSTSGSLSVLNPATGATVQRSQIGSSALNSMAASDDAAFYVEGANCTVTALSRTSGAQLWSRRVSNSCDLQRGGVTVSAGVVLATTTTGGLHALDATTGAPLWTIKASTTQTFGTTPAVANGIVYTGWDTKTLTAVSLTTGATIFTTPLGGFVRSTPTVAGGLVYVGDDSGTLYAVDATTGAITWKTSLAAAATNPVVRSTPVVAGGLVLVTVAEQGSTGSVVAVHATTGVVAWQSPVGYSEAGVAVGNGVVYATTSAKKLYALSLTDGTIQASSTTALTAAPAGAPLVSGARLFVAGQTGSLQAFALSTAAATTPPATSTPSGQAMPVGNQAGWTQAFTDDFSGSSVNTKAWSLYNGTPGAYPRTLWRPKNAVVSGGEVNLAAYYDASIGKWTSAGMTSGKGLTQTYGKWEIRMRSDKASGIDIAALLWPTKGWPPEVDFAEDDNGARTKLTGTLHYGSSNKMIHSAANVDMTKWHTYGVIWTPGHLQYTVDGTPWATIDNANVPSQPMVLDIQTQTDGCQKAGSCTVPGQSTVDTDIDWVVGYHYTPAS